MNTGKSKKTVWTLLLTIAAILAAFSFAWADAPAGRGKAFGTPDIYDPSGNSLYSLDRNVLMEIRFSSGESTAVAGVTVTQPDGSPDSVLPELATKTGKNGYVVTAPAGGTRVTVYYRPTLRGAHRFTLYYYDADGEATTQTFSFQSEGSDGGSGGCGTGAGTAALLAVIGFAAARKRNRL